MNLNSVYITVGVAIILVLVTALVGPFFVDWTVYRSTFETYAERALGHKVTVLGDADIRLLPSPAVTFSDVRVGAAEDPLLVVSRFQMRIELPPLMKGEFRVLDMSLDRPHLSLSLDEEGRLDWLTAMKGRGAITRLAEDDIAFDSITVVDGAVSVIDARTGQTHLVDHGNLQVSARTLAGPYKIDGSLTYNDTPYSVRLATGRQQDDGSLRVKGALTPAAWPVELAFDGSLSHVEATPVFDGTFDLASIVTEETADLAWRVNGDLTGSAAALDIPSFEFRFGPEDRLLSLDGQARLDLDGDQRFEVRAKAKQLDLDRLHGGGPQEPISLKRVSETLLHTISVLPRPDMSGVIALDVPAIVAGGGLVHDVRLDLETIDGGWRIARLAGRAPGRTVVAAQGDLSVSAEAPAFRGNVSVNSEQPGAFAGWLSQSDVGSSAMQPVSIGGRLSVVPEGAALDNLRLTIAGSEARGGLAYRKPRNGNDVFSLSLDADVLDLDELEQLAGLFEVHQGADSLDVSLRLRARRVDIRGVEGKGLAMEADYSGGGLRVDRLFAEDLAGAKIDVSGRIDDLFTAPAGSLSGTLDARELTGVVAILESVWPDNGLISRLDQASDYLVPARFEAEFKAAAANDATDVTMVLDGLAGGVDTRFEGTFRGRVDEWHGARIDADLGLSGPDGGQILRQLGFDILPVDDLGTSEFKVTATGRPEDGLDVVVSGRAGDALVSADGQLRLQESEAPRYRAAVTASVPDLAPFALLAGRVLPVMAGDIEADISFDLTGNGSEIEIGDLSGTLGGVALDGSLAGDLVPTPGDTNRRFKGTLHASVLDLRYLSEAILGPDLWFSAGDGSSVWPTAAFGAPLFADTDLTLDLHLDELLLDGEQSVSTVRSELRVTPTMLRLDGLNGGFAGGELSGTLALRRSGAEGAVSGRFKLDNAAVENLAWTRNGRSVATGNLDIALDFDGAGRSIAVIVSGLTGGGTFSISNGELRGINPQAFGHVIRAADAGLDLRDEKIEALFRNHMEAGSLAFDKLEGAISIVGGRASARNVVLDSDKAEVFGSAEADFTAWTLKSDFSLKVDPGENAVTGADPQVGLLFSGPLEAPERRVDITPFTAYLTLRAFEQEVERVEKLQAEILERDRLLREIKRQKEDRARREQEAEEALEREVLEAEEAAERARREADEAAAKAEAEATARAEAERLADEAAEAKAKAERAERERIEREQAEQERSADDNAPVPDAPQSQNALAPDEDAADFASRIRSVLEAPANDNAAAGNIGLGNADVSNQAGGTVQDNGLPPLEPPQSVEDILAREIGLPSEALGDGALDLTPSDPLTTGTTGVSSGRSQGTSANIRRNDPPRQPRYRTLPNGLVVEIPAD
ncbi:AsmA-like C-terminal region-containing protein [Roseibium sp.]|uniref:AsmA family protein n=1 Tax=Roseibium sp. TaxID=1936156 RepID=UPI003A9712D2